MKRVLFVFDRVAHYHRELFRALEHRLEGSGVELHLLSGESLTHAVGRVGLGTAVVRNEAKYRFREIHLGSYVIRRQVGVVEKILSLRPDVVVNTSHLGNSTHWAITKLKRRLGFKLVAWQCGYEYHPGKLKRLLLGRFIPRYDHHLAYHSNARAYAMNHGATSSQVTVMHNTINEEKIAVLPRAEAREAVLNSHPSIGSRRIILFVGAVLAEKRIEVILQALDIMKRDDAVLVLIGDGDHLPVIRQLCASRKDVVVTGAIVEGVGPYFDAAEVYVLPGTGGLGINEAMAHSLPVVSSFADGSADDLVVDGENGYRLRKDTPEELAEKLTAILDDPVLARQMGQRSREMITGHFAFSRFIDRVTRVLLEQIH